MFRYKAAGSVRVDLDDTPDITEFINVAKDDALAYPEVVHRTYPSTVNVRMANTVKPFIEKSWEVQEVILDLLNTKLGLPQGALNKRHAIEMESIAETRCTKTAVADSQNKIALPAHTDFGSIVRALSNLLNTAELTINRLSCTIGLAVFKFNCQERKNGNTSSPSQAMSSAILVMLCISSAVDC